MAIDKSNSPAWVKVVIIVVATGFVLMVAVPFVGSILAPSSSTTTTSGNGQSSTNASDTLSAISKQYAPQVEAIDAEIAKDPNNADLLLSQARQYFDWAMSIQGATGGTTDARPMAALSVQYYDRAFAIRPGNSGDLTDYSVVVFYSGDLAKAIQVAEGVVAKDSKFEAAHFNLGVFYSNAGRLADAIKSYQTALDLDPKGENAEDLKSRIAALQQEASSGATTTP